MLIERDQLTSGSTWHAAGGFHTLNGDPNVAMLQSYTVSLYEELERISGQSCGMHKSPGIMLADTPERMEFLKMTVARGRYLGSVHPFTFYVSWVQNDVNQFGLYLLCLVPLALWTLHVN